MTEHKQDIFFVRRPIVAIVVALFIFILGLISLTGLPSEQYPDITPPVVQIKASYTGANATNVEESVAAPLEQEINGVDNMIYMKSTNANDGTMNIQVSFDVGTNPDINTVFTQNKVAAATAKLPEEVKRLGVTTAKSLPSILMIVAITSEDDRYSQDFLGNYALINIKDTLARIKGIGDVNVMGASDYSMRFWIKPERLSQMGITVSEIINAVKQQNVIVPGGKFGAEPAPPGTEFTYTVRLPDRLSSEEEFGNIVVRSSAAGSQVRLKDVARIELGVETYNAFTRLNKKQCSVIAIYQSPGSNAVRLAEDVKKTMSEISTRFPEAMRYDVSIDATKPIVVGIQEIVETLIVALILVVLVVYIFIQDWRATLIPTIAIPVSLMGAFIVFPLLGFSINTLSLLGLVLAIGIVVDDAIVVVEAVQVNMSKGMSAKEATSAAMRAVTGPVIATTLVLIAVFGPVAGMAGITGSLYQQFAITIVISVCFSSINALSLSPALCALLLKKPQEPRGPLSFLFKRFNNVMNLSTDGYMSFASFFARRSARGLMVIALITAGLFPLFKALPNGFVPEEDMGYYFVNIQLPDAASLQRSDKVIRRVEDLLMSIEEIEHVTVATGYSLLSRSMAPNQGFAFVALKGWDLRTATAREVIQKTNRALITQFPEGKIFAFGPPAIPGLGSSSGFSMMLQDRTGNSPQWLGEQATQFIAAANARPEVGRAFTTFNASVPQRMLKVDTEKALKAGINLNDIYNTISSFLGGAYINDFNRFGKLYKAYIQAESEYRQNSKKLDLFFVTNKRGQRVPLTAFVDESTASGPDFTVRYNLYRAVEVSGVPAPGYSSAQCMAALEELAAEVLPAEMSYEWTNMSFQERKASGSAAAIFAMALLFVFLILAAQYESWSLPIAILVGTPFAIFGAMLFVLVARLFSESYINNIFMQISLVMLIGMAAKNAILIIEFANEEFRRGLSLFDAALGAAQSRFRPILMTAFSFLLGVLPLVIATGTGSEARRVMGMALVGGMGVATVIGLFFYPMLFIVVGKLFRYERQRVDTDLEKGAEDV